MAIQGEAGRRPTRLEDNMLVKAIWTLSAIVAVGVGLLLPAPALFGGKTHTINHMVVAQN